MILVGLGIAEVLEDRSKGGRRRRRKGGKRWLVGRLLRVVVWSLK